MTCAESATTPKLGHSLAYAPYTLRREAAAAYTGLSPSKFNQLVKEGRMPQPLRIDGCVLWKRSDLENAINDIHDDQHASATEGVNEWDAMLNS